MTQPNFLLFIDEAPVPMELKNYFIQFDITIEHQMHLDALEKQSELPFALLIHWSILNKSPQKIHQIHLNYQVPLLIVNDSLDAESCILALESGADAFLIKPLHPRELHARINAIRRRVNRPKSRHWPEKNVIVFNNWRLIPSSRQLFNENNSEIPLSAGEYDLLNTFIQQPQRILDREFLLQATKQYEFNPFDRRIDVQISRLRQKIERNAKKPTLIKTIRNGGYMFTAQVISLSNERNL